MPRFCTNFVGEEIVFDGRLNVDSVRDYLRLFPRFFGPANGEQRLSFTEMGKTAGRAE